MFARSTHKNIVFFVRLSIHLLLLLVYAGQYKKNGEIRVLSDLLSSVTHTFSIYMHHPEKRYV